MYDACIVLVHAEIAAQKSPIEISDGAYESGPTENGNLDSRDAASNDGKYLLQ